MYAPKWAGLPPGIPPSYPQYGYPPSEQPPSTYFPPFPDPMYRQAYPTPVFAQGQYATSPPTLNSKAYSSPLQQQQQQAPESPQQQPQQFSNTGGDQYTAAEKFKTELCRKFALTGYCRYADMCQFAHGPGELRALVRHPLYKTSSCKSFEATGSCRYGARCRFIHDEDTEQLATVARGVPALNLQISEPTWEEAEAAAIDAVKHLAITSSPPIQPVRTPILTKQESPSTLVKENSSMSPKPLVLAPSSPQTVTYEEGEKTKVERTLTMTGRVKTAPGELSRMFPNSPPTSQPEVRTISSLIMLNSNSNGVNSPSNLSVNGKRSPRVLKMEEDVFAPADLDASRLPVASSGSWLNLDEINNQHQPHPERNGMKHSVSQPVLHKNFNDVWSSSVTSLPVLPLSSPMRSHSQANFESTPKLEGLTGVENQSYVKKAASFANQIWFESSNENPWPSMARARSVEGRLDIFRNLSDNDLAKTAASASSVQKTPPRLPSFDEKLGEVGLDLSDDEDRATNEGADDTEDEGFSVGKF